MTHSHSKEINPLVQADDQGGAGEALRYASDPSPEKAAELPMLELSRPDLNDTYEGRCRQSLLLAEEAFAKTGSWVMFFREVLGVQGIVRQLFSEPEEFNRFIQGAEFATLHEMLAAIRSQDQSKSDATEPERMITIRIPKSLHESLQVESKACGLSINKLSISKLLFPADSRFVPEQQGRRRGRRPGPQGKRIDASNQGVSSGASAEVVPRDGSIESSRIPSSRTVTHSWADRPEG